MSGTYTTWLTLFSFFVGLLAGYSIGLDVGRERKNRNHSSTE